MSVRLCVRSCFLPLAFFAVCAARPQAVQETPPIHVTLRVDANRTEGKLRPVWRYFGYDEPNYTYMKGGKKLLSEFASLNSSTTVFVRTHNLLTTGDGTPALKWGSTNAYTEDAQGKPRYDWTLTDRIFDTYRERHLKPYVQIGFMPEALSTRPTPYQHHWTPEKGGELYTGWTYPPKDYARWAELVYQWTRHCVERYGRSEAASWDWEVWNEPNIAYWHGTPEEYQKLYDYAVDAVRRALPEARVGGPEIAGTGGEGATRFLRAFLEHCARGTNYATGKVGSPLDFISFHAKGTPQYVNNHVRMGISSQLKDIDRGFEVVASFPEFKDKPIVIGESDPDGCAACSARVFPQNGYRNGTLYASYTAASFARAYALAAKRGVNFEGALTWAFEFEDQPWFDGFRQLATNGVDLPVFSVFRMFGKMGGQQVDVESSGDLGADALRRRGARDLPDIAALASLENTEGETFIGGAEKDTAKGTGVSTVAARKRLCVMAWNYHDDDIPGPAALTDLKVNGLPANGKSVRLTHYRIDDTHSNAFTVWKNMGSPAAPTSAQVTQLEQAGDLALLNAPEAIPTTGGEANVRFTLPRQGVSLLVFEW